MSLVESWPSTEARSNERLTHTPSSRSAVSGSRAASVCTKQSIVAKFGEIIPAPLHCALRRTVPDGSSTARLARFSEASVVWIACWKATSPPCSSAGPAARIPCSIFSTGRWWLIPPVEASAISSGSQPSAIAAAPCVLAASSSPRPPVAALAQPEFASTARRPSRRQRSWLTITGAAGSPVAVKRAALTGCSASHTSSPRSWLPLGLIPQITPAARKPAGSPASGPRSRTCSGAGTQREWKNGCGGPEATPPNTFVPGVFLPSALISGLPPRGSRT